MKQIRDLQLAVAIARVYEGDDGPVLRKLLQEDVLGLASREGDRWLASWAFWMLGRKDMAVRSLIVCIYLAVCDLLLTTLDRRLCIRYWRHPGPRT